MTTWQRGREILSERLNADSLWIEQLNDRLAWELPVRVPGTAIYMTRNPNCAPPALVLNFTHNRAVHERIVILIVQTKETPFVEETDRIHVERIGGQLFRIRVCYGFMQDADVPAALGGGKESWATTLIQARAYSS
jgi:KUP system potassium uptake protein